jgi:hypothetical protein
MGSKFHHADHAGIGRKSAYHFELLAAMLRRALTRRSGTARCAYMPAGLPEPLDARRHT